MATSHHRNGRRNHQKQQSISAPFNIQVPHSLRDPKDTGFSNQQLFHLTSDDNAREFALGHVHNPERFAELWCSNTLRPDTRRIMRKVVQIQTLNAVCNGFYRRPDGTKISLDKKKMYDAAANTRQYNSEFQYNRAIQRSCQEQQVEIIVIDGDCLDAAIYFKEKYPQSNPVVLNMASRRNPGGGWKNGAGAQEENLHRRTNMFQCLEDPYHDLEGQRHWDYQVPEFGGIYTPNASVFRGSEIAGYPFFPNGPKYISFIACSAYSNPPTETDKTEQLILCGKNVIENTRKKIEAILNIARENKHDIVILSAFGCGAYQNPPKHIAQLFKEVIAKEFSHSFKYIVFAIIDDHNAKKAHNPTGNIQPFAEIFQVDILTIDKLQENVSSSTE